jgi:Ferritin-like domain
MDQFLEDAADDGLSRRHVLAVGGFSVALAAVVAACAPDRPPAQVPQAGVAPTTTGLPEQNITDEVLLRTASSLEHSLVGAYDSVLQLNVLPADEAASVRLFREHHAEHAIFFEKATRDGGGTPFTEPNAAMEANVIDPALKAIADAGNQPSDLTWFVYGLENVAAGTFQSFVPTLHVSSLRGEMMSVGGVEARHAAVASTFIPTYTVLPPLPAAEAAATTTTSTTIKGGTTTSTPANQAVPVAQVPSAFGSLTAVEVAIAGSEDAWNILGPNSFEYVPTSS